MAGKRCTCNQNDHCSSLRPPLFKPGPCPCTKCKERSNRRKELIGLATAAMENGSTNCKQCIGPAILQAMKIERNGCTMNDYGFRNNENDCGCGIVLAAERSAPPPHGICKPSNTTCGAEAAGPYNMPPGGNTGFPAGCGSDCIGGCGGNCGTVRGMGPTTNPCTTLRNCNMNPGHGSGTASGQSVCNPCVGSKGQGARWDPHQLSPTSKWDPVQPTMPGKWDPLNPLMAGKVHEVGRLNTLNNNMCGCIGENDQECEMGGPCGNLRGPVGINMFANEQVNFFITFFMEFMGILVFFAICTLTFWMTVGYYIVHLFIELVHADRNVQYAVAIIIGVLVIAFAFTLVGNKHGPCSHLRTSKAAQRSVASISTCKTKCPTTKCPATKYKTIAKPSVKKSTCGHCALKAKASRSSCIKCPKKAASKLKFKPKPKPKPKCKTSCNPKPKPKRMFKSSPKTQKASCGSCPNKSKAKAKIRAASKKQTTTSCPHSSFWSRRYYSDCEGRQIFQNAKRYAIPTEMKQPPPLFVWIRDFIRRLFGGRA